MNNEILCSTGAYIGYENGYDPMLIPVYGKSIRCDAFEFMVVSTWNEKPAAIAERLCGGDMRFRTLHSDKFIGMYLSDHDREKAFELFRESLRAAAILSAEKLVLHLWGGFASDSDIDYNISAVGYMLEACRREGITLCIENVPCSAGDPIDHWKKLARSYPEVRFIFDTRFGAFAGQLGQAGRIFTDSLLAPRIVHMHVSDFVGPPHDFKKLRPIPHPGGGTIDFESFFKTISPLYGGTVTLESPSLYDGGRVDVGELNESLEFIRKHMAAADS